MGMNTQPPPPLGTLLLELPREQAKPLFACRGDDAVRDFVVTVVSAGTATVLHLDQTWQTLARCFGDGTLDLGSGEPPLCWCLLGGKPMCRSESTSVLMVRPDMVRHVAEALAGVDEPWLKQRAMEVAATADEPVEVSAEVADLVPQLRGFYEKAAESGSAILFVIDR